MIRGYQIPVETLTGVPCSSDSGAIRVAKTKHI